MHVFFQPMQCLEGSLLWQEPLADHVSQKTTGHPKHKWVFQKQQLLKLVQALQVLHTAQTNKQILTILYSNPYINENIFLGRTLLTSHFKKGTALVWGEDTTLIRIQRQ